MTQSNKTKITQYVLDNLQNVDRYKSHTVDKVFLRWWMTGRSSEGMRITDEGKVVFEMAGITHYDIELKFSKDKKFKPQHFIIQCNKKIKCPYYLGLKLEDKTKIPFVRLYDNKIAVLVALYGDLMEYLENVK
jgi:hypothetical protein